LRRAVLLLVAVALGAMAGCSGADDATPADTTPADTTPAETEPVGSTASTTTSLIERAEADLTIVDLNMLHGLTFGEDCPTETEACRAEARLGLLWDEIEASGCPDVVTLQEVGPAQIDLLPTHLPDLCEGTYELASDWIGLPVEVAILSRLPVLDHRGHRLSGLNWASQWARLDSELGPVEVVTAHFASSSDPFACADGDDYCADICDPAGTPGDCHPREVLALLDEARDDAGEPAILQAVTGDLNRPVTDPRVSTLLDAGFVDAWTLAGNPDCDPATGEGCTCCVSGPPPLVGLDLAEQDTFVERIDFILVRTSSGCDLAVDTPTDADGDGVATGPFARQPAPTPVDGVVWASDHAGVQADLSCR